MVVGDITLLVLLCIRVTLHSDSPYDFGLFENERLLRRVFEEDQQITIDLENVEKKHGSNVLKKFLESQLISQNVSYIQHPVNVYHLLKKYAVIFPQIVNKTESEDLKDHIRLTHKRTKHLAGLSHDDYHKCLNGLVHMIHSFDLDMEQFSRGVIPPLQHGNGDQALVAAKPLMADDLVNIAVQAVQFGYLGTAAAVLKVGDDRNLQ